MRVFWVFLPTDSCWAEWPLLLSEAMVFSRTELLLRTRSGFMALQRPGSELMSMAPINTEASVDAWHSFDLLRLRCCPRTILVLGTYWSGYLEMSKARFLPKVMFGSVTLQWPDSQGDGNPCYHPGLCKCPWSGQPPKTMVLFEEHTLARAMLNWVAYGDTGTLLMSVWPQAAAKGHVWVYGPAATGVCGDVCGPWSTSIIKTML